MTPSRKTDRKNQRKNKLIKKSFCYFLGKNYLGQVDKDDWQRAQDEKALELKEKAIEEVAW